MTAEMIIGQKMIIGVRAMGPELAAIKVNMSPRYSHPRMLKSGGSVRIRATRADQLDKHKIICMGSKPTLSRLKTNGH